MPRALAIETSGRIGSVALAQNGTVLDAQTFEHGLQHAAGILPMIDRLCATRGWKPTDLTELYLSAGPGSFTGLRIGVTLAKTLAFATGLKLVAVPTVRVLVENAPRDARHVIIVLDAKRDQIFTARFERESPDQPWQEREPAHLDSLTAMLNRASRPVHLLGEGIPYHRKFIPADDPQIFITPEDTWRARAHAVAQIGRKMAEAGQFTDPDRLTPIYIRKPEAEEKWEQQNATVSRASRASRPC
jgi:tRNA threonylcarbamoyladenosine biosynthesis protein TsaB